MMTTLEFRKRLFVAKVDEVRRRVSTGDYYDLLMAAGLLRHLILDGGSSLAIRANRELRQKLRFVIKKRRPSLRDIVAGKVWVLLPSIHHIQPDPGSDDSKRQVVGLKALLATRCLDFYDQEYSRRRSRQERK
jgi:hypothetical protein